MSGGTRYYIVESEAMPDIFRRVAEANRLLKTGEESTVNGAVSAAGVSRSAYYKYKDAVQPFQEMLRGRIVTFQILLRHEPGNLSRVLNIFAETGVNILTINQNIPVNGCAVVTLAGETTGISRPLEEVLQEVTGTAGVIRCEILAG